jgi:serine/threonine-protein kinase
VQDSDAKLAAGLLLGVLQAVPAEQLRPDVPPALAAVVARCMQRRPGERFATAAALREAILAAC